MSAIAAIGLAALKYAPIVIGLLANKAEKDHPKGEDGAKTGPKKLEQVMQQAPVVLNDLGIELPMDKVRIILEAMLAVGGVVEDDVPASGNKKGQAVAYPIQGTVTFTHIDPVAKQG